MDANETKEAFQKELRMKKAVIIYEAMQEVLRKHKPEIIALITAKFDALGEKLTAEDAAKVKL